jgi:hypothetical protein
MVLTDDTLFLSVSPDEIRLAENYSIFLFVFRGLVQVATFSCGDSQIRADLGFYLHATVTPFLPGLQARKRTRIRKC